MMTQRNLHSAGRAVQFRSIAHRRRAGFNLIELMVVISTMAALMSFATVLLGLLFRADHAGHDAMARQLAITQLSRQFRADVHAAKNVETPPDEPGAVELILADGRSVSWTSSGGTMSRIDRRGAEQLRREAYRLPEGATTIRVNADSHIVRLEHRALPAVVLENSAATDATPPDVLTIEAAIGISIPRSATPTAAAEQETP